MTEGSWLTTPSSVSGLMVSGLERLRACLCAHVRVGSPFYLQV